MLLGVRLTSVCCVSLSSESRRELHKLAARLLGALKEKAKQLGNKAGEA